MFQRLGRLRWALLAALVMLASVITVASLTVSTRGSGRIYFGLGEKQTHLLGMKHCCRQSQRTLGFVAHLVSSAGSMTITAAFQRQGTPWATVWRFQAQIPSASDDILAGSYRMKFLRSKGIHPPGTYRLVIKSAKGKWLAGGRFVLRPG